MKRPVLTKTWRIALLAVLLISAGECKSEWERFLEKSCKEGNIRDCWTLSEVFFARESYHFQWK